MTRDLAIWADVAAADRFSVADREELALAIARGDVGRASASLITCHRVEQYGVADEKLPPPQPGDHGDLPSPVRLTGEDAVRHLVRLSVGLESAVLGEDQVLHQVRVGLADLHSRRGDPRLIRLFELAVAAGRRVRAAHPAGDRNLGELAVRWLENRAGSLRDRPVVVAGAGRMGRLAAAAVARRGATITIASRSVGHAAAIAERVSGRAADLSEGAAVAENAFGVVVALGGPWAAFAPSSHVPVVDLSFPLALSLAARTNLDDSLADVDRIFREAAALQPEGTASRDFRADAEAIAGETMAAYHAWSAGRASVPTLRTLRERSEEQRRVELDRLLRRLPDLEPRERALVEAFSERLVAGLLHAPSAALRDDADGSAAAAAERLFRL